MAKTVPHFLSIILDDPVQDMLVIPESFVRGYGNYLTKKAFLKVPNGEKWQVDLVKTGTNVWFGNGWKPFADYYSVSYGTFLMFGFEDFKTRTFSVLVFDKSTSEIDYPFHLQEDDSDDEELNVEEQVHQVPVNEENSDTDIFIISSEDESRKPSSSRPRKEKKKKKQENDRTQPEAMGDNGEFWTDGRTENAANRAKSLYKSENSSFCIVMQPSYVGSTQVAVPVTFADKYFKKQRGFLTLISVEGRTWSVEYFSYGTHQDKYRNTKITTGWRTFSKENHLAVGDVCVFEVINHNATKLKVVICRENQIAATGNSKQLKHKKMSSLKHFTSVNPYFTVKLQKSYLDNNLITIPTKFMAKCKNRSMENATLQVEKEEWRVKLLDHSPDKRFRLSAGVSGFFHDNALKVGDVCIFELINSETMLLKVSIFQNV